MVKISVNASHPMFTGLDMKHVRIIVGTLDEPSLFYNFKPYGQINNTVSDAATNHRILELSPSRPLIFESNYDFYLLGNVVEDPFQCSRALAPLVNYIRNGILTFEKDGAAQTADQVMQFTP
jgi:hypothetical protein